MNRHWRVLSLIISSIIAALFAACSCQGDKKQYEVINPDDIKQTLAKIDSARVSLVGFEPKEPGYNPKKVPLMNLRRKPLTPQL